jgi:hypothetical protein
MKNKNYYDEFINKILSLPGDVRGDLLRIAGKENNNPYITLFQAYSVYGNKHNLGSMVRGIFEDYNLVH